MASGQERKPDDTEDGEQHGASKENVDPRDVGGRQGRRKPKNPQKIPREGSEKVEGEDSRKPNEPDDVDISIEQVVRQQPQPSPRQYRQPSGPPQQQPQPSRQPLVQQHRQQPRQQRQPSRQQQADEFHQILQQYVQQQSLQSGIGERRSGPQPSGPSRQQQSQQPRQHPEPSPQQNRQPSAEQQRLQQEIEQEMSQYRGVLESAYPGNIPKQSEQLLQWFKQRTKNLSQAQRERIWIGIQQRLQQSQQPLSARQQLGQPHGPPQQPSRQQELQQHQPSRQPLVNPNRPTTSARTRLDDEQHGAPKKMKLEGSRKPDVTGDVGTSSGQIEQQHGQPPRQSPQQNRQPTAEQLAEQLQQFQQDQRMEMQKFVQQQRLLQPEEYAELREQFMQRARQPYQHFPQKLREALDQKMEQLMQHAEQKFLSMGQQPPGQSRQHVQQQLQQCIPLEQPSGQQLSGKPDGPEDVGTSSGPVVRQPRQLVLGRTDQEIVQQLRQRVPQPEQFGQAYGQLLQWFGQQPIQQPPEPSESDIDCAVTMLTLIPRYEEELQSGPSRQQLVNRPTTPDPPVLVLPPDEESDDD